VAVAVAGLSGRVIDGKFIGWLILLLLPLTLFITGLWWRRLDEAAREAHKWAWYWGATGGLILVLPLLIALDIGHGADMARPLGFVGGDELIMFGMLSVLVLQVLGYAVAWAYWWLRRR